MDVAKACLLLVGDFFLVHAHASFSRKGDRKSMELPGRTQGNPDGGLWAADI